jgi:hypothetical protein
VQERRVARHAAGGAEHRLDEDRRDVTAVRRERGARGLELVVRRDDERVRHVDLRRPGGRERQHTAVMRALEHQHRAPAGVRDRGREREREREQVGLGARVGEAQPPHRRDPRADLARERRLAGRVRRQVQPAAQRARSPHGSSGRSGRTAPR